MAKSRKKRAVLKQQREVLQLQAEWAQLTPEEREERLADLQAPSAPLDPDVLSYTFRPGHRSDR